MKSFPTFPIRIFFAIVLAMVLCSACSVNVASAPAASPESVPLPTAAPTATPIPSPEPTPFEITSEWFDDALFIGDSITGALKTAALSVDGLGNADIAFTNGFTCRGAFDQDAVLSYAGSGFHVDELVEHTGASKVFIMLAMNDIGSPDEEIIAAWNKLIDRILERCPNVRIFIQSGTPVYDPAGFINNDNMRAYNALLQSICEDRGCTYVDVCSGLTDEDGRLKAEYHLDYVHFDTEGCRQWINSLHDRNNYSVRPDY